MRMPEDFIRLLSLHRDCTGRKMAIAQGWSPEELEISTDTDTKTIRRMVSSVLRESHRMRGFLRLSSLGPNVLYAEVRPVHDIVPDLIDFFALKFPSTLIILGNSTQSWAALRLRGNDFRCRGPGIGEALAILRSILGDDTSELGDHTDVLKDDVDEGIEAVWKAYYSCQACPERTNHALFRQRMPERSARSARLGAERNDGVTLLDFFP